MALTLPLLQVRGERDEGRDATIDGEALSLIFESCQRVAQATQKTILANSRLNAAIFERLLPSGASLSSTSVPNAPPKSSSLKRRSEDDKKLAVGLRRSRCSSLTLTHDFPVSRPSGDSTAHETTELSSTPSARSSSTTVTTYVKGFLHTMGRKHH